MAMDLIGDLDIFFNSEEFAEEATLVGGEKIKVLFNRNAEVGLMGIESAKIIIEAKTSDVVSLITGDWIAIGEILYYVIKNEPDGTGVSYLTLSEDA